MIYTYIELNKKNSKMELVENYGNLMKLCKERIFTNIDIMLEKKRPSERTTKARLYEEILEKLKIQEIIKVDGKKYKVYRWECLNIRIYRTDLIKSEMHKKILK